MVAYSFKQQFMAPILSGAKQQTIRADRKRHARIGEQLQLYTGMRTKSCRLIGRAACIDVEPVQLVLGAAGTVTIGGRTRSGGFLDEFARLDGFAKWDDLLYFWELNHPDVHLFSGVIIRWRDLRAA